MKDFQINKMCWQEYERGKIDRHTLARKRFDVFFDEIGVNGIDTVRFNEEYLGELPKHPYFLEDAPGLLTKVKKSYRLGLITNGLQQVQRPRLKSSGIEHHFDFIVVSGEIGLAKPDPAFFDHAHRAMDEPDKQTVMVIGDGLYSDMRGGIDYGYRTCWYNPDGHEAPEDINPDHEIRSHSELISLLGLS